MHKTHLTPKLITERVGVHIETVLGWINRGELKAANVSRSSLRPRWRVAKSDLSDFLDSRSNLSEGAAGE